MLLNKQDIPANIDSVEQLIAWGLEALYQDWRGTTGTFRAEDGSTFGVFLQHKIPNYVSKDGVIFDRFIVMLPQLPVTNPQGVAEPRLPWENYNHIELGYGSSSTAKPFPNGFKESVINP
jgi:hypothetical protein